MEQRVKDILKDATNTHLLNIIKSEYIQRVFADFVNDYRNDTRPANVCFHEWALAVLDEDFSVTELKEYGWI